MTLDEIKLRENRVAETRAKLAKALKAVENARDEYAEQEANRAGIFYGKTKVAHRGAVFFVYGRAKYWAVEPFYNLARVKKDGTMTKTPSSLVARIPDLTIISEETP